MRSKISCLRKMLRSRTSCVVNTNRAYTSSDQFCEAHMNELPVPCGSWDDAYAKRQQIFNQVLMFGTLWFFGSMALAIYLGAINLNFSAPAIPGPPPDYVEECDDAC